MQLGREAFRRHVESYLDAWSDASVETDARAVGKQVVGRIRYTGAGRATGIEVETREYGALYDFRAGRIRRVRQFATTPRPSKPPGCGTTLVQGSIELLHEERQPGERRAEAPIPGYELPDDWNEEGASGELVPARVPLRTSEKTAAVALPT
jgi:hypothetical protein